ncbi:MAG: DUF2931 family protein [Methylococcales bacterium]
MSTNDTKFEWIATESAPEHYPMEIIQGTFYYHGEDNGLYIPSGGTLSSGWGQGISNHHVHEGPQILPDRIKIIFFSYAEKQFYQGVFDLPYEKIVALFTDGVENPREFPNGKTMPVYSKMMVGIAPGGAVAVWVTGSKKVEVFFGQAEKVEIDPTRAFDLPFKDKQAADDYIAKQLVNTLKPEELELLKKDGIPFDLWSRYRKYYDWQPTFTTGHNPEYIRPSYLNGEYFGHWVLDGINEPNAPRPVPSKLTFRSSDRTLYTVTFDESETIEAFKKLGASKKRLYLEFDPKLPREKLKIRLFNEDESIELNKFVSKK